MCSFSHKASQLLLYSFVSKVFWKVFSEFIFSCFILHGTECTSPFLLPLKCHPSHSWLLFKGQSAYPQVTSTTSGWVSVLSAECYPAVGLCLVEFYLPWGRKAECLCLVSLSHLSVFWRTFQSRSEFFCGPSYIQETRVFSVSNSFLSPKSKKIGSMETTWSFTSLELSWVYLIWNKMCVFSSAVCWCLTTNVVQPKAYRSWLHHLEFSFCCCCVSVSLANLLSTPCLWFTQPPACHFSSFHCYFLRLL